MTSKQRQFVRDILTTVVESPAIAYWARAQARATRDAKGYVTSVTIDEVDESDGSVIKAHTIDEKTIWLGFRRAHNEATQLNRTLRGILLVSYATTDAGDVDCECADVLVQLGLFGEIVYG